MADEFKGALQTTTSATKKVLGDALSGAMIGAIIGGGFSLVLTIRRILKGQPISGAASNS